jgi:flagellar biosynthesis/type III secretory pathway chaperone
MNNLNHLAEVMMTEAELTEQLIDVMKQQQHALIMLDPATVESTVDKQQELLLPIEGLEHERQRLTTEVLHDLVPHGTAEETPVSLARLMQHLNAGQAQQLSAASGRLLAAVETMMRMNQANQYLIEHSRKFVRETVRMVTGGNSRRLVDQRI